MKHKVFISHSSKDKQMADALVEILEREGFPCWIAPRNILYGETWAKAIADAISSSKYFVLLLNENSNASKQVIREVDLAVNKCEMLFPLRIDECRLCSELEYYLSTAQWANTDLQPIEKAASQLAIRLRALEESDSGERERLSDIIAASPKQADIAPSERKSLERRAAEGDAEAQYKIGMAYAYGNTIKKDIPSGVYFLDLAAKQDHPRAQLALAQIYMQEKSMEIKPERIFALLQKASAALPEAMLLLGERYSDGNGCAKDNKAAFRCYFEAAMDGLPEAMYMTGRCLERGIGREKNTSAALVWYEKAANAGHEAAMIAAAFANADADKLRTAYWYGRAADAGNCLAIHNLAVMYLNGNGILCDKAKAEELFRRAAEAGYVPSMTAMYEVLKESKPKDAIHFAIAAADAGDTWAQVTAGVALLNGTNISRDTAARAAKYLKIAAEKGDKYGQYHYGRMFLKGKGVSRNTKTAVMWLEKAAEQGLVNAQLALADTDVAPKIKEPAISRKWLLRAAAQEAVYAYILLAYYYRFDPIGHKLWYNCFAEIPAVSALWLQRYQAESDEKETEFVKSIKTANKLGTGDWDEMDWVHALWQAMPRCFSFGDYRSVRLCAERLLTYDVIKEEYGGSYKICRAIVEYEDIDDLPKILTVDETGTEIRLVNA